VFRWTLLASSFQDDQRLNSLHLKQLFLNFDRLKKNCAEAIMILWYLQGVALKSHLLCYKMYQHKMYWFLIVRILVQSKMLKKKPINLDINCTFFCHMCDFVGFNNFGSNLIAHNKNLGNLLGMYWEHDRNVWRSWYECVENFMGIGTNCEFQN
jgi:hypothetical protein